MEVGVEDEAEEVPVFPVVPVVPASEEPDAAPDDEAPLAVAVVDRAVDDDDGDDDAPDVRTTPAPGWSWATTIPMATVAPVAATITERVRTRSRARALSLSAGVLGRVGVGMWSRLLGLETPQSDHGRFAPDAGSAVALL
ncbi:MAG TPA: hypothetical protein VHX67_06390 [Acidimicrobiales bacterium]|nr:hypothetical protein [Acidimicrobiales bacterium]